MLVFRKIGSRLCPENTPGPSRDKKKMMFVGGHRIRWKVIAGLMFSTLNSSGYLQILKHYDQHFSLTDLVFQQDHTPVHKREVNGPFLALGGARLAILQSRPEFF